MLKSGRRISRQFAAVLAPNGKTQVAILVAVSLLAIFVMLLLEPIPQDPGYHNFSDDRQLFGISNFWNTVSNVAFVLMGILGLTRASRLTRRETKPGYMVLCSGVLLVGFGSAYYHLEPSNESLVWDRLPMTIAFMALFVMMLEERVLKKRRPFLLPILILAGALSVFYWAVSEAAGRGDLRPYALVQFLPVALIPLIILLFRRKYLSNSLLLSAFLLYFVAKAFEHFDAEIFSALGYLGGHPLKHIVAAAAALCTICAVPVQRPVNESDGR